MRRLSALVCTSVAVTVLSTAPAVSAAPHGPTGRHVARTTSTTQVSAHPVRASVLAPVSRLRVYDTGGHNTVIWTNPPSPSFDRITVRLARGGTAPKRPWTGTAVRLTSPVARSAQLSGLARDARYTVAVWTRDAHHGYSAARTVTFTTDAAVAPNGTLRGRVVDKTNNHPLAGAQVLYGSISAPITGSVTTGSDGRYSISVPPGRYFVGAGGDQATGGSSDATGYQSTYRLASVRAGRTGAATFALLPGAAVTGRVTDVAGAPLAGVRAYASAIAPYVFGDGTFSESFLDDPQTQVSAADGTYTVKGLPTAPATICFASDAGAVTGGKDDASGYADRCTSTPIELRPRTTRALPTAQLARGAGSMITGRVTDSAGRGVGQASVRINSADSDLETYTDLDGSFSARGLSPGKYLVCASAETSYYSRGTGLAPGCHAPVTVTVGHPVAVTLVLKAGAAVTGKIVGPHGHALGSVYVIAGRVGAAAIALTDATGHYLLRNLRPGRITVCFNTTVATATGEPTGALSACYRHRAVVVVRAGAVRAGIDAQLAIAGAVSGQVFDAAHRPARSVEVLAIQITKNGDGAWFNSSTNAAGQYSIRNLPAGTYRVCAATFTSGPTASACRRTTVRLGHTTRRIDVSLRKDPAIVVTVRDADGHRLGGVDAVALARCPRHSEDCEPAPLFGSKPVQVSNSSVTGADGTVALTDLTPGSYAVCLFAYYAVTPAEDKPNGYADTCTGSTFSVLVTKHATTRLTMTLGDAGSVTGRVTDTSGAALAGIRVTVSHSAAVDYPGAGDLSGVDFGLSFGFGPSSSPADDMMTGADGTFTVRSVRPGRQTVCFAAAPSISFGPPDATSVAAKGLVGSAAPAGVGVLSRCVGAAPGSTHGGTRIPVVARRSVRVDVTLTPASAIAGTATTTKHKGARALVVVFAAKRVAALEETDSHGAYRINGLAPGTYSVCFADTSRPQCYRNHPWSGDKPPTKATPVRTTSGRITTGIDAVLAN